MNYEPNLTKWMRDAIVIHDADAKEPKMLMRVTGFTRDGMVKTKYINPALPRREYRNNAIYLHDPARFGIPVWIATTTRECRESAQLEWERVRWWNNRYPINTRVRTTSADGGFETFTVSAAYYNADCHANVTLERGGNWLLQFVEVIP